MSNRRLEVLEKKAKEYAQKMEKQYGCTSAWRITISEYKAQRSPGKRRNKNRTTQPVPSHHLTDAQVVANARAAGLREPDDSKLPWED